MSDPTPTADEIARWAAAHHGWTPEDYPDSGEFCVECGEHMPCPTTRLLALVAAQAEQIAELRGEVERLQLPEAIVGAAQQFAIGGPFSLAETTNALQGVVGLIDRAERAEAELHALHATDDYQRWARAVTERDAAREAVGRVRALCREAEIATAASRGDGPYRARVLVADVLAALDGGAAT